MNSQQYCNSLFSYSRFQTREVKVGDIGIGGDNPIRIQTMTTTDTMNTEATVEQSIRCIEAGSELIRITAPSIHEANNLLNIKNELRRRGYKTPLVADIHFTPNAAEVAARIVEKVRINPGNYADKKKFQVIEYSDQQYAEELDRIREKFVPLIRICKQYGTAMRIGTNHGSLSDRIMSRYGDTPLGMVESAFEFLRIAEDESYYDIVLSMKASNPKIMVQAYRLLVQKMMQSGRNYPIHLGVTEAGDGIDGRIKSAIGIGALLEDGIGDTIRVSLTEEPEFELPVAKTIADRYNHYKNPAEITSTENIPIDPFQYVKRHSKKVLNIGGSHSVPVVVGDLSNASEITPDSLKPFGYRYDEKSDKWRISDLAADYVFSGKNKVDFEIPGTLVILEEFPTWKLDEHHVRHYPLMTAAEYLNNDVPGSKWVKVFTEELDEKLLYRLKQDDEAVILLTSVRANSLLEQRRCFFELLNRQISNPVIIGRNYPQTSDEAFILFASTDCGSLLLDGLGDGIFLSSENQTSSCINETAFGILQASRTRISKSEYISCPSCGRTLFDLQETTAKIRSSTNHLKGVKIAIMGCIVNGPGEMADADYGYVGSGPGKITLYKGREIMKRNVNTKIAVDELISLIKESGDWVEQPSS